MNEIPELKDDLAFLKKFDSRSKVWKEFDSPNTKGKERIRSNFLLHPKRFNSDSECSSSVNTPRKFYSATIFKNLGLDESNNNVRKRLHCHTTQTCRINVENCCVETGIGDASDNKTSNPAVSKKPPKAFTGASHGESFDKKFKTLVERSLKVLTNIRVLIEEGITPPDGEEDYFRRVKRLQEFSARFSRNYLYPLIRHMDELSLPEKMPASVINQKFLYSQQVVLQGLQAYYNHLPSSVGKCGSEKLKALLDQIIYMCHVYELLRKDSNPESWEFINAMRSHVELLLEALTAFDMKFVEKKPRPKSQNECIKKKIKPSGNKSKSKLSMYLVNAAFSKDLEYRKGLECLKKKKYSVKSRYKTAGYKHRPPIEKQSATNTTSKIKLFHKESSGFLKSNSKGPTVREDDIKTMVEIDSEFEAPPNTSEHLNHENSIASSKQLVQDSDRRCGEGVEDGNVEKALEVLRKFFGKSVENKQTDFLEKIANEVDKRKEERESMQEKSDKPKKKPKDPVVTVTGAKNARLICIRDDNSVEEDDDVCRKDKEMMTDAEIKLASSETQTDIRDDKRGSRSAVKISRLPKNSRRMLAVLPKEYAINIIQYKLRCNQFHKRNPMYRKSAHIQPWVLMGRISDDILDYILQSVSGELEVNEILENLYNAEFQY